MRDCSMCVLFLPIPSETIFSAFWSSLLFGSAAETKWAAIQNCKDAVNRKLWCRTVAAVEEVEISEKRLSLRLPYSVCSVPQRQGPLQ